MSAAFSVWWTPIHGDRLRGVSTIQTLRDGWGKLRRTANASHPQQHGVDLCTICLTGGFYSEFTGMFSANRCVPDTITKNASTLQVWSMCNLYSITNESGCDPQSDRVYDTTGAAAVRRAKVA
jgi:hypothetical protein